MQLPTILLFYFIKKCFSTIFIFRKSVIIHRYTALSQLALILVPPHKLVHHLGITGSRKLRNVFSIDTRCHKIHTKFHPDLSSSSLVTPCGQTDMISPLYIHLCPPCRVCVKTRIFQRTVAVIIFY